jgi:TPR repeat protein
MYQYGRGGLSKDDGAAARLFKLAADRGDASAQVSLGNLAKTQIDNLYAAVPKKRWARWLLRWLVPRKVRREFDNVFKFAGADEKEDIIARFQQRHGCGRAGAMRLAIEVERELRKTETWR